MPFADADAGRHRRSMEPGLLSTKEQPPDSLLSDAGDGHAKEMQKCDIPSCSRNARAGRCRICQRKVCMFHAHGQLRWSFCDEHRQDGTYLVTVANGKVTNVVLQDSTDSSVHVDFMSESHVLLQDASVPTFEASTMLMEPCVMESSEASVFWMTHRVYFMCLVPMFHSAWGPL